MGLFENEPDEPDGPALFQTESDRPDFFPLQDEADEPDPDFSELPKVPHQLFQDEADESDRSSDSSGCLADCEGVGEEYHELVQLNFATLTKFLESQLCQLPGAASESVPQAAKRRRYNNTNRASKAQEAKKHRENLSLKQRRIPRNNPETCPAVFRCFFFWCVLKFLFKVFEICYFVVVVFVVVVVIVESLASQERIKKLLASGCKCSEGKCFQQFMFEETKKFLDIFEARSKVEQDTILFLAWSDSNQTGPKLRGGGRREFHFLGKYMRRVCFEALLGVSSHRIDKIGAVDLRFGKKDSRPSPLAASIDAFCLILYNSIAEPLPQKQLSHMAFCYCFLACFFYLFCIYVFFLLMVNGHSSV